MSYILDAVNKAEQERRASQSPALVSIHSVPFGDIGTIDRINTGRLSLYAMASAALLAVAATSYVLFNSDASTYAEGNTYHTDVAGDIESSREQSLAAEGMQLEAPIEPAKPATKVRRTLSQASSIAQAEISHLNFSFHVYSSRPEQRTIIINGKRVREKDPIQNGMVLEEVTENGVLISLENELIEVAVIEQW